jgi:hypothetical protein
VHQDLVHVAESRTGVVIRIREPRECVGLGVEARRDRDGKHRNKRQ